MGINSELHFIPCLRATMIYSDDYDGPLSHVPIGTSLTNTYHHLLPPQKTALLHDTSSIQFSSFRRFQAHSHSISPGSILNLRHLHGLFHVANFHFGNFLHDFDVFHLWHLHDIVMDRLQDHRHLFGHQPDRQIATVGSKPWGFNIHH